MVGWQHQINGHEFEQTPGDSERQRSLAHCSSWSSKVRKYLATEKKEVKSLNHVQLFVTPWTVAHQAPLSMGFSRQEYWSGLSFSSPGDLPNPGIEPTPPTLQTDCLLLSQPGEAPSKGHKG